MKIMFPALSTPTGLRLALPLLPRRACLWTTLAWAVLAFVAESNGAGVTEAWVQRSNILVSNSQDRAYKIVRDAAGDIIVTGSSDNGTSGL
ncbi:MAG: hypothetical protein NT154_21905, partial [Verrucomicrobia bacterium]|nr:hypothetical protein [Verrucomicrobiota bacterium]